MCKSTVMKQAHAMARATVKAGDNYHVTLGACIRAIHAKPSKVERVVTALRSIEFGGVMVTVSIAFMVLLYLALIVGGIQSNTEKRDARQYRANMVAIDTAVQAADDKEFSDILAKANAIQAVHLATYK